MQCPRPVPQGAHVQEHRVLAGVRGEAEGVPLKQRDRRDADEAVLSARVLEVLQYSSGEGRAPSISHTGSDGVTWGLMVEAYR